MPKVIQIRGIPDDVHAKLVAAAGKAGQSLTGYLADELALIAKRADLVWHNRDVIETLRTEVGSVRVPAGEVLRVLHDGREERTRQSVERITRGREE